MLFQSFWHVALLRSPTTQATTCPVRRHRAVHVHRFRSFRPTKLHILSTSRTSPRLYRRAGYNVSHPRSHSPTMCFQEPICQQRGIDAKACSGDASVQCRRQPTIYPVPPFPCFLPLAHTCACLDSSAFSLNSRKRISLRASRLGQNRT